jgi:nitrite reductase/ring-hydroxylating ferredoxin subunit
MAEFIKVAKISDIPEGESRIVQAGTQEIALFNVRGAIHAIGNTCLHQGGPLGEGWLDGPVVTCPWHGWTYDVTTGRCTLAPGVSVPKYAVKIEGGDVFVEV